MLTNGRDEKIAEIAGFGNGVSVGLFIFDAVPLAIY